jgi:hypothetical protein
MSACQIGLSVIDEPWCRAGEHMVDLCWLYKKAIKRLQHL